MAKNDIVKNIEKVGKIVGAVAAVAATATPVIAVAGAVADKVEKTTSTKSEEGRDLVIIPSLYSDDRRLTVEEVKRRLNDRELKVELTLALKDVKYKDCFDQEVVKTNPKEKQRVRKGSFVEVYYVTSEVIKESKDLFKEFEKQKAEIERAKLNGKLEKLETKIAAEQERHKKVMEKYNEDSWQIKNELERLEELVKHD
jgi:hypothetical protein